MVWITSAVIVITSFLLILLIFQECYRFRWVLPYIKTPPRTFHHSSVNQFEKPLDIYIALCDHYRPFTGNVSQEIAELRVVTWCREYERIARKHVDSSGNHPVHTIFYSESDYNPYFLDTIARSRRNGITDVEILIDHNRDTPVNFKRKIEEYRDVLFHHHGLLRKDERGRITYGFVHGKWALDNARPDGRWCGVKNEIAILKETGCYADFTYPSAPDITQPPIINSIYFTSPSPEKPVPHEAGTILKSGCWSNNDLLCIQGPLVIHKETITGLPLIIDRGELGFHNQFSRKRMDKWIERAPQIKDNSTSIFIKLFTAGMIDQTLRYLFSDNGLNHFWSILEQHYNDNEHFRIHYMSAWSMYNKIHQLCTENATINLNKNIK